MTTATTEPTVQQLFDLTGRTALITGGTGWLGAAFSRALAEAENMMTANPDLEPLIAAADAAVQEALRYLEGPGATAQAKVDQWGPKEVLSHFLFWHEVTVQGIESLSAGGQPLQMSRHVDEVNAEAVADRVHAVGAIEGNDVDLPALVEQCHAATALSKPDRFGAARLDV